MLFLLAEARENLAWIGSLFYSGALRAFFTQHRAEMPRDSRVKGLGGQETLLVITSCFLPGVPCENIVRAGRKRLELDLIFA